MNYIVSVPTVLQIAKSQATNQSEFNRTLMDALELAIIDHRKLNKWIPNELDKLGITIWPIEFIHGIITVANEINRLPHTVSFSSDATEIAIRFTA